jgi:hypothetical protein
VNIFSNWTPEMVAAHKERVRAGKFSKPGASSGESPRADSGRAQSVRAGKRIRREKSNENHTDRPQLQNGTLHPPRHKTTWKSGWREIGGKNIYARSRWEANYARYLEFLMAHQEIARWEHEPETFWFDDIKRGSRSYLPDFRVTFPGGRVEYHEVKGWMDARSKTKIKRMRIYHPNVILRVMDKKWFKANTRKLSGLIPGWEHGKITWC